MSETAIATEDTTLFARVGGDTAINAVVDGLYDRILNDEEISRFFQNTSMNRQRGMMRQFLHALTGGPIKYEGRSMREAHAKLDIRNEHFDRVATHLSDTLKHLNVPEAEYQEIMAAAEDFRNEVVIE